MDAAERMSQGGDMEQRKEHTSAMFGTFFRIFELGPPLEERSLGRRGVFW